MGLQASPCSGPNSHSCFWLVTLLRVHSWPTFNCTSLNSQLRQAAGLERGGFAPAPSAVSSGVISTAPQGQLRSLFLHQFSPSRLIYLFLHCFVCILSLYVSLRLNERTHISVNRARAAANKRRNSSGGSSPNARILLYTPGLWAHSAQLFFSSFFISFIYSSLHPSGEARKSG